MSLDSLPSMLEDITGKLDLLQSKLTYMRTESSLYAVYQENLESIEYASDDDLTRLKGVLKELKRNVT